MLSLEEIFEKMRDLPTFLDIEMTGPNVVGHFGDRPLHVAAVWGDLEAISVLHVYGAELDAIGEHGYTPLQEAVEQRQIEAVRLLLKLGARRDIVNDNGLTALGSAELDEDMELIALLKEDGVVSREIDI